MRRLILFLLAAALVVLFCLFFVWPTDVFSGQRHTLGALRLPDGNSFVVTQFWNHTDFYSTVLEHRFPDGRVESHTLDGDDRKRWSVRILPDTQKRIVTVDGYEHFTAPY
jgi:hypothetical protein